MKYTITINQKAAADLGDIDLVDCAIIGWLRDLCISASAKIANERVDGYTWVSYQHAINDMPLLGLTSKEGFRKRLTGLLERKYFAYKRVGQRVYVKPLPRMDELYYDRQPTVIVQQNRQPELPVPSTGGDGNRQPELTNPNTKNQNTGAPSKARPVFTKSLPEPNPKIPQTSPAFGVSGEAATHTQDPQPAPISDGAPEGYVAYPNGALRRDNHGTIPPAKWAAARERLANKKTATQPVTVSDFYSSVKRSFDLQGDSSGGVVPTTIK